MSTMAKDLFSTFPQKVSFGAQHGDNKKGTQHAAVESFSADSVASGGYRPRKQSVPLEQRPSMSLINRGLLNPTGQNNCFLNSAVQILWHIDVFRRSFRNLKGHTCVEEACIFCALKELFKEFQHGGQSAIPPDVLRKAMAECYIEQRRFQLGLMDDAAECFEKLLEQIHLHLTGSEDMESCGVLHCLPHQKFAITILERTECSCGATSEPLSFVQFVHYISSSAIVKETQKFAERERERGGSRTLKTPSHQDRSRSAEREEADRRLNHSHNVGHAHNPSHPNRSSPLHQVRSDNGRLSPVPEPRVGSEATVNVGGEGEESRTRMFSVSQDYFGRILNKASATGEFRKCPDYERCKKTVSVKRILLNCPDVVCLGMIWDSDQPSVEDIMSVVYSIGLKLQLSDVFDHVFSDGASINQYELTALIAYYGHHYSTFCYHTKMHEWIYFDDARFRKVGTDWRDVCEEIRKAHYQPLLLVYTNPFAEEIKLSEAPNVVTVVQHRDLQSTSKMSVPSSSSDSSHTTATPTVTGPSPDIRREPTAPASTSEIKPPVPSPTHVTDPLTFSIQPVSKGMKSTTPVVGSNHTSAMPLVKVSPKRMAREVMEKSSDDDLMTFSVTPALLGIGNTQHSENSVPTAPTAPEGPTPVGDLIEFSLTPAVLNKFKSSAVYNSSGRNRILEDSRRSLSNTNSNPNSPFASPSASPATSKKTPPISSFNPSNTRFGQLYSVSSTSPSNSPSQIRSSTKMTSNSNSGNLQSHATSSDMPKFFPKWDHFEDQESPAKVTVAPQKLLPSQEWQKAQVGVASKSHDHGRVSPASPILDRQHREGKTSSSRKVTKPKSEESKNIQDNWMMVSQANTSEQDSEALRQLRRIVSQPGFEDEKEALVPMGHDLKSPELRISTVNVSKGNEGNVPRHSPVELTKSARNVADPLPSLPSTSGNSGGRTVQLQKAWFPQWESPQSKKEVHPRTEPWQPSRSENKHDKLDYADLDLTTPGYEKVRGKSPEIKSNSSTVDYTEIVFPPSNTKGSPKGSKDTDNYTNLADLITDVRKIDKTPAMPLGYDPDYAVPEKIAHRVQRVHEWDRGRSKEERQQSSPMTTRAGEFASSGKQSPLASKETRGRRGSPVGSASPQQARHHHTVSPHSGDLSDISKYLHGEVKKKYQEALSLVTVAHTSRDTDSTVAMMLFQKAASQFREVIQEPSVKALPVVYDRIKTQKEEASKNSLLLQKKGDHAGDSWEKCRNCGQKRYLDDDSLCGPCQLREKMRRS